MAAAVAKVHSAYKEQGKTLWINLTATEYFKERTGYQWPPLPSLINVGKKRRWKTAPTFTELGYGTGSLHNVDFVCLGATSDKYPRPIDFFIAAENGIAGLDYECPENEGAYLNEGARSLFLRRRSQTPRSVRAEAFSGFEWAATTRAGTALRASPSFPPFLPSPCPPLSSTSRSPPSLSSSQTPPSRLFFRRSSGQFSPPVSLESPDPSRTMTPAKRSRDTSVEPPPVEPSSSVFADATHGFFSGVTSIVSSSVSFVTSCAAALFAPFVFRPLAPATRVDKKQRIEASPGASPSRAEEEMVRRLEEAEAFHICPNSERKSMKVTDHDRQRVVTLLLSMGWYLTKQGECKESAINQRIALAAINQASAELGFTKPMVETTYAQARAREWYVKFKGNELDVRKDSNSGRRSLDDTYGFDRMSRLWRAAVKENKDWASFKDLASWIRNHTKDSGVPVKVSSSSLIRWFEKHNGESRRKISKPELSEKAKVKRVAWSTKFLSNRRFRKYYTYLDEKWFYLESRREKRKLLPQQPGETEEEAAHEHVSCQNRRFPLKRMYVGVVGEPLPDQGFNGKVCLIPCVIEDKYKKTTTHCAFCDSLDDNNQVVSAWHEILGDDATARLMTPAQARDQLAAGVELRDGVKERIVFVRVKKAKVSASAGVKAKQRQLETLREGQSFGDKYEEYFIRVQNKKGDKRSADTNVDGKFMKKILKEQIGPAIRRAYWWVPKEEEIYCQLDNAGGHGSKEVIEGYVRMMKEKFNIILVFQSPSSPDFNALDRGVWMCSQAETAKLSRNLRRDFKSLHECVMKAWNGMSPTSITNICNSVVTACEESLKCGGGNEKSERRRSSKKLGINLKTEPVDIQAGAESESGEENDHGDEAEVDWWDEVSDQDSDADDDEEDDDR